MSRLVEIRRGVYRDSVSLMLLSRELGELSGVRRALVAMATELNLDLVRGMGFAAPDGAAPVDLLVAIDADDESVLAAAVDTLDTGLRGGPADAGAERRATVAAPTVAAAARQAPTATIALVSTPGRVAAVDAADALSCGLDVMVFSDNVRLGDEVALKRLAAADGLLVMGPDCGTAVVDGVGLGFANVVRPGPVALVAASGTGAQQIMALLDAAEVGVRHCLGVGGRDLGSGVAGRSTFEALRRLDADDDVELVVVVSKPPDEAVAAELIATVEALDTPVVLGLLGPGRPDLTMVAAEACGRLGVDWVPPRRWGRPARSPRPGRLRGLFCGGTLCTEAELVAGATLGGAGGHTYVDFGEDELTRGRPHPMIDPSLRLEALERAVVDPDTAVVLLDVVLGLGAHPDPATDLLPVVEAADAPVVVALVGTRDDPQDLPGTAERLARAGAVVHASNAAAAREAASLVAGAP